MWLWGHSEHRHVWRHAKDKELKTSVISGNRLVKSKGAREKKRQRRRDRDSTMWIRIWQWPVPVSYCVLGGVDLNEADKG